MNKSLGFFINLISEKQIKRHIPPIFKARPGYLNPLMLRIISYFFIKYKPIILTKNIYFLSLILLIKLYEANVRPVTV